MKKIQSLLFAALVVLMGGFVQSCDDDDTTELINDLSTNATFTLGARIINAGNMPEYLVEITNAALKQYVSKTLPNTNLAAAKLVLDKAIEEATKEGGFLDSDYSYTLQFYLADANGKEVYSRTVEIKGTDNVSSDSAAVAKGAYSIAFSFYDYGTFPEENAKRMETAIKSQMEQASAAFDNMSENDAKAAFEDFVSAMADEYKQMAAQSEYEFTFVLSLIANGNVLVTRYIIIKNGTVSVSETAQTTR
jgi:hypothetical protein